MSTITVFSQHKTNRLLYVLDWLLNDVLNVDYKLVHHEEEILSLPFFFSYGKKFENAVNIPDAGLLWEQKILPHEIKTGEWNGIPTLYHEDSDHTVPFDLFSAIFFLLSRYEEYYGYTPDKHERYPVTESILYRKGWLERPLVDEWIFEFFLLLNKNSSENFLLPPFQYLATYDIDIAFAYKYKAWKRIVGGFLKDLATGNFEAFKNRLLVLSGGRKDPYDSFDWMHEVHSKLSLHPIYFVLASLHTTPYDKNIDPDHKHMQRLILEFKKEGEVGMHPSYYSFREEVFREERNCLEKTIGSTITKSRQHYIRLKIPDTYHKLIEHGIKDDYSMGYGSKLGFRAGTGRSFFWYDLKNEKATELRINPFCFMDSTARFEEKLSAKDAFERLNQMRIILAKTQSQLITVFHNFSLGSDEGWTGWAEHYKKFIEETSFR